MALVNTILKIYNNIPLELLNLVAPLYHLLPRSKRYGNVFQKQYDLLYEQEKMSKDQCVATENEMFVQTVRNAYENVPYYRTVFEENKLDISEIVSVKDAFKIPFLTKDIIRENLDEMISNKTTKEALMYLTTSGSTGNPLGFYQDKDILMKEWAYVNHIWGRVGYKPDSSRLILRGKVFREQKRKGQSWQWDAMKRELSCNIFDMTESNLKLYCEKIEKYKPEYIHGYMSAVILLCKYIEKHPIAHQFKGILATSETVLENQREYVENVLNARVFSFYGHSERLVIAGECEYCTEYHVEPMYGYAEIIDANGNIITEPGVEGELVTTGFMNTGMPLIRYKTGDIAAWSEDTECTCGRNHKRLAYVSGRWKQDVLVNSEGALVSLTALNMHSKVFDNIVKYQFYQEEKGEAILKVVPTSEYCNEDKFEIEKQINEKTGNKIKLLVCEVEDIPLNKNGKYKIVDQRLKLEVF